MLHHYKKYFYSVHADTPELKKLAYQLRYQVYADRYGDDVFQGGQEKKIEMDEYDNEALHGLLFHKPTNSPVGCIRVVPFKDQNNKTLPLENFTQDFDSTILRRSDLRTPRTGEVSRMAIESSFRRRSYDISFQLIDKKTDGIKNRRLKINYLPLCMTLMGMLLCKEANLEYSVALMEPKLAKLISMFGIQLTKAGDIIEFHGERAPYKMYLKESYDSLRHESQEIFHYIGEELNFTHSFQQWPMPDQDHLLPNYRNVGKTGSHLHAMRT